MVERNRNGRGIASCLVSLAIAAVAVIAIAVGVASVPLIARLEPGADAHRAADAEKPLAAGKSTPVSAITPRRFRPAIAYGTAS